MSEEKLRRIYNALRPGQEWETIEGISLRTRLHPVQVRVGLAALEREKVIFHLSDDGAWMLLRTGEWNSQSVERALRYNREHLRHRRKLLDAMLRYAEGETCRRQVILKYFGDPAAPVAQVVCCDVCRQRTTPAIPSPPAAAKTNEHLLPAQRAALIILDSVRLAKVKVGRRRLAQILHGSRAGKIQRFGHDRHPYYGKLAKMRQRKIEELIEQLLAQGYLKSIGGQYPTLCLTQSGERALKQRQALNVVDNSPSARPQSLSNTVEVTLALFHQGLSPETIAAQRGLAVSTIYGHLARTIAAGGLELEQVVPRSISAQIELTIQQIGSEQLLDLSRILLPQGISLGQIRCVIASRRRTSTPLSVSSAFSNLNTLSPALDPVKDFLSQPHPRPLTGPWQQGWALDFHSRMDGDNCLRTPTGELTYRLKYEEDETVLSPLLECALVLFRHHPEFGAVDVVVPVPSTTRRFNPVMRFAEALAQRLQCPMRPLEGKARSTQPQKEMQTLAQKRANVSGAFVLTEPVRGLRLLLVDDIYDSGATLDEITRLFLREGASQVHVLALTRTIHTDA